MVPASDFISRHVAQLASAATTVKCLSATNSKLIATFSNVCGLERFTYVDLIVWICRYSCVYKWNKHFRSSKTYIPYVYNRKSRERNT